MFKRLTKSRYENLKNRCERLEKDLKETKEDTSLAVTWMYANALSIQSEKKYRSTKQRVDELRREIIEREERLLKNRVDLLKEEEQKEIEESGIFG